jgi:hypothetical protein
VGQPRERSPRAANQAKAAATGGVRIRRLARGAEDGYQSGLVPGLRSSEDAERLADELAFAEMRLAVLERDPPGSYAEVAGDGDLEERTWLAFLIAYLGPLDEDGDPFAAIERARTPWADGELPVLDEVATGPRSAHDPSRGTRTLEAYKAWAARSGSQAAAFVGDPAWTPERRFERVYERLALPGLHRDARFDLLVTLGRIGVYELEAGKLQLGGGDEVTLAAKRALGIGDTMLLERRARDLADACQLALEALDLGLYNWGRGDRARLGLPAGLGPDPEVRDRVRAALRL